MRRGGVLLGLAFLASASRAAAQVETRGWIEYQGIAYAEAAPDRGTLGRNQLRFQPEIRIRLGADVRLFSALELRLDGAEPERNRVYLDEAYGDFYIGPVDVRVGRQIFAWGRADALNPTDFFGAWDFTDVLDATEEKLAQDALRATWYVGRWSVEGVLALRVIPSTLPVPGSRWWPEVGMGEDDRIETELEGARWPRGRQAVGVRLSGSTAGVDVAATWYRGPWHLPVFVTGTMQDLSGSRSVLVVPTYERVTGVGVDLATVWGATGLHAEGAAYLTADRQGTDPGREDAFIRYVLGADHTLRGFLGGRDVLLLAEWIQDVPLSSAPDRWSAADLNHVFRRAVFLRAGLPTGDYAEVDVQGVYDASGRSWVVQVEPNWVPRDGLNVGLTLSVPGGRRDAFFGTFADNRRLHLRVRYSF